MRPYTKPRERFKKHKELGRRTLQEIHNRKGVKLNVTELKQDIKGDKELDLTKGDMENATHKRCPQHQCVFYQKGGCKNCDTCGSKPFILGKGCSACHDCAFVQGHLRWKE